MTLSRYANSRDANEPAIISGLRLIGASVVQLDTPVDLLVGWRGKNFLLEVKLPAGPQGGTSHSVLTHDQEIFFKTWHGQRCVVRDINDALLAIGANREEYMESGVHS